MKHNLLLFTLVTFNILYYKCQDNIEIGYNFGLNGTISINNEQNINGLTTPFYPNTTCNNFYFGVKNKKHKFFTSMDIGELGVEINIKNYPNIHPFSNNQSNDGSTNLSTLTSIGGSTRKNTQLLQFSCGYKYMFLNQNYFTHQIQTGIGYFITNINSKFYILENSGEIDKIGYFENKYEIEEYKYLNTKNLMLIVGYEIGYKLTEKIKLNASFVYNQGLKNMLKISSIRSYYEEKINHNEFDRQITYTKFSHYSILFGLSYTLK